LNLLALEPLFKALEMDQPHGAGTLARRKEWVAQSILLFPETNTTDAL